MLPSNLTTIEGVPDSSEAVPGMAFFAGSGPYGKTCGDCVHRGYSKEAKKAHWNERLQCDIYRSYRTQACAMYKALAGHHGPAVDASNKACKYFEQKPPR